MLPLMYWITWFLLTALFSFTQTTARGVRRLFIYTGIVCITTMVVIFLNRPEFCK